MQELDNSIKEALLTLEKHVKKILRKSLKNNTLDYAIQFSVSNVDAPGKVKYAAMVSSPAKGIQPITFMADSYAELEAILKEGQKSIDKRAVEVTFHESRINSYKSRIAQHEDRIKKLNDPGYDEEEDVEMELVS